MHKLSESFIKSKYNTLVNKLIQNNGNNNFINNHTSSTIELVFIEFSISESNSNWSKTIKKINEDLISGAKEKGDLKNSLQEILNFQDYDITFFLFNLDVFYQYLDSRFSSPAKLSDLANSYYEAESLDLVKNYEFPRLWFEYLYYDLFHNDKTFDKTTIKYKFDFEKELEEKVLALSDFDFITADTKSHEIPEKFMWSIFEDGLKITEFDYEVKYKLQHDSKYKFVIFAFNKALYRNLKTKKLGYEEFLKQVLAITNDGKVEIINDFTENSAESLEFERAVQKK